MRGTRYARLVLAGLVLVAGCKGFWDLPNNGGGGGGKASGVFYVLNQNTQQVAGFAFASGSTTPTAITNGSSTFSARPLAMAISPNGGFLYVSTGGGIFVYSIGSGGVLTLLNNQQAISADLATSIAVDGSGSWVLESASGTGVMNAIPVGSSTGILDSTRTLQTFQMPVKTLNGIASSPANSSSPYVFVAMGTGGTEVIPFVASSATPFGTGAQIAVKGTGGGATAIAVDPTNRLLYVGETVAVSGTQTGGLRMFTISSTQIKEVTGSPYATAGTGPSAILPSADGFYVYVANQAVSGSATGNITGFPINQSGGSYTLGSIINTVTAGTGTNGLAEDNTHTYVLAINASNANSSADLNTYTFDATTGGKLVPGATAATGSDPVQPIAIAAVP